MALINPLHLFYLLHKKLHHFNEEDAIHNKLDIQSNWVIGEDYRSSYKQVKPSYMRLRNPYYKRIIQGVKSNKQTSSRFKLRGSELVRNFVSGLKILHNHF